MKDVATYRGWKIALSGLFGLALGLVVLAVSAFVPVAITQDASKGEVSWWFLLLDIPLLFFGWMFFTSGFRRVRETAETGCFLRAGPEGLALRLPGELRRKSLWLSYDMMEYSFRWDEVSSISWSLGTDSARGLHIRARGGELDIDGVYFNEPIRVILGNIRAAASPYDPPIPRTTL